MKKLFLLFSVILLANISAHAQTSAFNGFIEKYKQDKAFTYAFLSKDLFEVVAQTDISDKDWKKLHNVVQNIGSLSLLTADSIQNGLSLYKEAKALVAADAFDELLAVRDEQDNVRIWVKSDDDVVTDLILLVGSPDEFVLICFAGNLKLNNFAELTRLFDAEAVEQLARTTEKVAIDFKINPNPSNGEFTLSYITDEHDLPAFISVIDQTGRQLAALNLSETVSQRINFPDLPSGLYWVQLKTQQGKIGVKQIQILKK